MDEYQMTEGDELRLATSRLRQLFANAPADQKYEAYVGDVMTVLHELTRLEDMLLDRRTNMRLAATDDEVNDE